MCIFHEFYILTKFSILIRGNYGWLFHNVSGGRVFSLNAPSWIRHCPGVKFLAEGNNKKPKWPSWELNLELFNYQADVLTTWLYCTHSHAHMYTHTNWFLLSLSMMIILQNIIFLHYCFSLLAFIQPAALV